MARKGTVAWKKEYIGTYYGINMKTNKVDSVSVQRDGTLSKGAHSHNAAGTDQKKEVTIVFGLVDVEYLPISLDTGNARDRVIAQLTQKAEARQPQNDRDASEQDKSDN